MICANCGIEIRWQSTIVDGKAYCCWGCTEGGPCTCDYSHLPLPTDNVALVKHIHVKVEVSLFQNSQQVRRTQ